MEAIDFVEAIRARILEEDHLVYTDLLQGSESVHDPLWKEVFLIYQSLTLDKRDTFLRCLRLIQANTISHFLGILDGSTYLNDSRENFVLITHSNNKQINGELQNLFLEKEEF